MRGDVDVVMSILNQALKLSAMLERKWDEVGLIYKRKSDALYGKRMSSLW